MRSSSIRAQRSPKEMLSNIWGVCRKKRKKGVREIHRPARHRVAINRLWCRSLLFPACRLHNTCISRLHILGHVRVHRRFLIVYFTFRPQASAVWKIAVHSNSAQKKHGAINPISKQTQHMPHPEEKEKGPLISIKTSNKNLDPIPEKKLQPKQKQKQHSQTYSKLFLYSHLLGSQICQNPQTTTTTTTTTQETGHSHGAWEIICWTNQTLRQQLTYTGGRLYRVFENRASFRIHAMGIGVLRERVRERERERDW